jgi:hypothetical protein
MTTLNIWRSTGKNRKWQECLEAVLAQHIGGVNAQTQQRRPKLHILWLLNLIGS